MKGADASHGDALLFGMGDFVKGLKEALDEHFVRAAKAEASNASLEPLAIAVIGQWGSGKTRVLHSIQSLLEKDLAEKLKKSVWQRLSALLRSGRDAVEKRLPGFEDACQEKTVLTVPIFFNPWRYEQEAHLVVPLLKTTERALSKLGRDQAGVGRPGRFLTRAAGDIRDAAWAIASGLSFELAMPGVAKTRFSGGDALKNLHEAVSNRILGRKKLGERYESIYYDILTHLENVTQPEGATRLNLVFIIDDLDRCLPEKAVQMLEAIKLFLDVPRCAFVLGLDEEVVERGIAHRYRDYNQQADSRYDAVAYAFHSRRFKEYQAMRSDSLAAPITGHEYLEKIVHLAFRLPVNTQDQAREFLETSYPELFKPDAVEDRRALVDADTADNLKDMFLAAVPYVPRKLMRAAESLKLWLRVADLRQVRQVGHVPEILFGAFVILQQFAPEVYRLGRRYSPFLRTLHDWYKQDWDSEESLERNVLVVKTEGLDEVENPYVWRTYEQPLARAVRHVLRGRSGFHPFDVFKSEVFESEQPFDFDQVAVIFELTEFETQAQTRPAPEAEVLEEAAKRAGISAQPARPSPPEPEQPRVAKAPAEKEPEKEKEKEGKRFRPVDPEDFFGQLFDKRPDVRRNAIRQQGDAIEGKIFSDTTFESFLNRVSEKEELGTDVLLAVAVDVASFLAGPQVARLVGERFGGPSVLMNRLLQGADREDPQRQGIARLLGVMLDERVFETLLATERKQDDEAVLEWWPALYPFLQSAQARTLSEAWFATDVLQGHMQSSELSNRQRRAAGLLLGVSGWLPEDLDAFLPVKDEPFVYGEGDAQEKNKTLGYDFWIGKYPVTNTQYGRFVDAGGYDREKRAEYWDEAGRGWLEEKKATAPHLWDDAEWNNPIFPVVGVSLYEAQAYAGWLETQVNQEPERFRLEAGKRYQVRLSGEEEWERVARGTDGRAYPWGNEFEMTKTNTAEGRADATTAVATFPDGQSTVGVWDMSGNVWEWTASPWSKEDSTPVVRGGSWFFYLDLARSSFRNIRVLPEFRNYYLGFRLVVSLAHSES